MLECVLTLDDIAGLGRFHECFCCGGGAFSLLRFGGACFRGYDWRVNLADDADIGFVFDLGRLSVESLILGAGKCLWLLCLGEK